MSGDGMPEPERVMFPQLRWVVWLVALAGYTYLLIVPGEWLPLWLQHTVSQRITDEFSIGKLAHVGWYALFTAATFLLPVGWRGWGACVAVMSLHGFGTEFIQTFTGRNGCWFDVGIDHIGIATGLLLGGLGYWLIAGRAAGLERMTAAPQVQGDAGGED
jgi:hypothetical protein